MSNSFVKTKKLAVYAIFSAIIAIISFIPIKTMGLEITLSMVPVAVGAICFGPVAGLVFGTVFGAVSFLQCVSGYSVFGAALLQINPWLTLIVCIPTRMLAGYLTGLGFKALSSKLPSASYIIFSLVSPLLNTVFFMSMLVLFFFKTDYIQGFASALGAANPIVFIILFVGINGLVELVCGFVLALPCSKAVSKFLKF